MFVIMAVTLYTSRVVLYALGEERYGIYNIVAGIVVLFSFLNNSMSTATQRFLNYELGKFEYKKANVVFCESIKLHICICFFIIFLAETIGLWFLKTKLKIPDAYTDIVFWVYQMSIITFVANVLRVPFNATIIAYEKMDFYAYISIIEASLKLLLVFLLLWSPIERLLAYSILICIITTFITYIYKLYCNKKVEIAIFRWTNDKEVFRKLMNFSGWTLFGSTANVSVQQGLNILLNWFFGVALNATMGIANQVTNAMYGFVSNFQVAFNPQITKQYVGAERSSFYDLIFNASKYSFYLFLLIGMPVFFCIDEILNVWLVNVPPYTASFCRLLIVFNLITAYSFPLWTSIQAQGDIKTYQLTSSLFLIANLPISFYFLKAGYSPDVIWFVRISIEIFLTLVRLWFLKRKVNFPVFYYIINVLVRVFVVSCIAATILWVCKIDSSGFGITTINLMMSFLLTAICILLLGINKSERKMIFLYVVNWIDKTSKSFHKNRPL